MDSPRAARRFSPWGVASLVLLLGEIVFGEYHLKVYDRTGEPPWISFATAYQICVVVQLTAVACGVVAMRRDNKWWALTVVPAAVLAVMYFFGAL